MYKSCISMRFSTIFSALFNPYIAHERTAHYLDFISSLVTLCSYSYWAPSLPKLRFAQEQRAIEWFQRAMHPALLSCDLDFPLYASHGDPYNYTGEGGGGQFWFEYLCKHLTKLKIIPEYIEWNQKKMFDEKPENNNLMKLSI